MHLDWTHARDGVLLDEHVAYLNTGAFGPTPRAVFERFCELRRRLCGDPTNFMLREVPPLLWRARESLGAFLGARPERLLFTSSVSAAVSLVANSISTRQPGEIVLTDCEYTTMRWCWERAARRLGLSIRTVRLPDDPSDHDEVFSAVTRELSEQTRILFFSHVLSASGAVLPARELCSTARSRGILSVVDGAHAPAFIELNLSDIGCDFYAGSASKWLLAPAGSAFLYFGSDEHPVEPATVSWGYAPQPLFANADLADRFGSTPRLRRLECEGTRDISSWLLIPEAIGFQARFGHARVRERMRQLASYALEQIAALGDWQATASAKELPGGISAFLIPPDVDPQALCEELWHRFQVEAGVSSVAGRRPVLRICTHIFNNEQDVDQLAQALVALRRDSV
jgi:isopenicillin-N epimerase